MKTINTEELKQIQFDILMAFHTFCVEKDLEYSLAAGTLLGAVRHKGYIPWDDDIDICMTRPNYDKFIRSFNGSFPHYYVAAPELDWNYYAPYANVCDDRTLLLEGKNGHNGQEIGVKIDIFPVDGCTGNLMDYLDLCNKSFNYCEIMRLKRRALFPSPRVTAFAKLLVQKIVYGFIPYASLQKRIHNLCLKYPISTSPFVAQVAFDAIGFRVPKEMFDEYVDVEFEGKRFKAVKDYDTLLRVRYGDYMQLPPEEERVPHHGFTAFWKDGAD